MRVLMSATSVVADQRLQERQSRMGTCGFGWVGEASQRAERVRESRVAGYGTRQDQMPSSSTNCGAVGGG
jgi:hypothetical protein